MRATSAAGSECILILAPHGRDAQIAAAILREVNLEATICDDISGILAHLAKGAGAVLIVEEALDAGYADFVQWIDDQPPWSDLPVVILANRGAGLERNPAARRFSQNLGNVSFLERPFHPTTLVSVVEAALRGRRRQYEARERIETIRAAEEMLERRVEQRTRELAVANIQLADQIAERERVESALRQAQRLEAVGQLTSGVAHDFNNLLMVVLGNIRQLQKTAREAAAEKRLETMAKAAERGAQLTAQLLAFSRRQKLDPRAVDLNETVLKMQDLLQSTMGGSIHIRVALQPNLWTAMIDPTQIELVILNLAINARDAMGVGGTLTVETANATLGKPKRPEEPQAGDYVMVAVRDTGEGMTPEVLAKVFEPFFTTKEVGKGSGLGLSQVYGLAAQSGGGVRIESEPGAGAVVQVYLPRSEATPEAVVVERESLQEPPPVDCTVLVVDDDAAVREISASLLTEFGYTVIEAESGEAAMRILERQVDIDLLLLDFAMPGMNGAELASRVRDRWPELPIVFVTGYIDADALPSSAGGEVLRKPFQPDELAQTLRVALGAD